MKTISFKLPRQLDAKLATLAQKRRTTISAIIREALETYSAEEKGSFTDMAGSLCGSLVGPRDLASNHKHLNGYGE